MEKRYKRSNLGLGYRILLPLGFISLLAGILAFQKFNAERNTFEPYASDVYLSDSQRLFLEERAIKKNDSDAARRLSLHHRMIMWDDYTAYYWKMIACGEDVTLYWERASRGEFVERIEKSWN